MSRIRVQWSEIPPRRYNKYLSDRIYRINRIICRTAPEEWPETHIGSDRKKGTTRNHMGKYFLFSCKNDLAKEMV